jgi:hypothetical protein
VVVSNAGATRRRARQGTRLITGRDERRMGCELGVGSVPHRPDPRHARRGTSGDRRDLARIEKRLGSRRLRHAGELAGGALIIAMAGSMLAVLHGIEAALWGAVYLFIGAVGVFSDAILYSVDSISTRGASGLNLQQHWKMMGALEAVDGMLLFGISTAFLFSVLERVWRRLARVSGASHH